MDNSISLTSKPVNQLKAGVVLSYMSILVVNIVGLFLTPYIIKSLGDSEYGLYTLIGSFIAYLGVLDFGMNNAVIRYVSKYRINNDTHNEENFLGLSLIVYIAIAIFVGMVGGLLYFQLDTFFSNTLTVIELKKAKTMLLILILNLMFTLPGGVFLAICTAYERFIFTKAITLIKYLLRSLLVVWVLIEGGNAISIVIVDTVANLLMVLASSYYVLRILKVKFRLHKRDLGLLNNILSYSFWIFITVLAYNFYWHSGQLIVGMKQNTTAIAVYGVGILLGGYYGAFSAAINSLLVPRAMLAISSNDNFSEITRLMIKYGRINLIVLLFIFTGFYIFGETFVLLWVGKTYLDSVPIALIIMLALTPVLVQGFGNSILEAKRKNRFKALISLATTLGAITIGWYLFEIYGMYGLVLSLTVSMIINAMLMMFYYRHIFGLEIMTYVKCTYLKPIVVAIPLSIVANYILSQYLTESWLNMFLNIGVYTLIYIAFNYFLVLNNSEKQFMKEKLI